MARHKPILTIHRQRANGDCAIACIATWLNEPYEDVLSVASKENPMPHNEGLHVTAMRVIAEKLGAKMRPKRRCNFNTDCGILSTERKYPDKKSMWHVVIVVNGLILDLNEMELWLPDDYRKAHKVFFRSILVPDNGK